MTTQTLTIADFLLARLSEDEATARTVRSENAGQFSGGDPDAGYELGRAWWWDDGPMVVAAPADRILAECKAKRAIVEDHRPTAGPGWHPICLRCQRPDTGSGGGCILYPCPTIRALAAIWSDHPDYRAEWA